MDERYVPYSNPRLYEKLNGMLFDKAANVDVACYENVEFYDTYTKAASQAYDRALSVLTDTAGVFASACASIYVVATIFSIHWIAGLFSFMPMIGNFFFSKVINRIEYEKTMEGTPHMRRINYVNRVLYLPRYAKEIRMTKIKNVLDDTYETAYEGLAGIVRKYWKRLFGLGLMRGVLCFPLVFEGMWLFAAYCAMVPGTLLIGDFVVLANAIVSTTWMLTDLTGSISQTYQNGLYAKTLKDFLAYEAKIPEDWDGLPAPGKVETLELRDVSFRYPAQEKEGTYALRHVNYTFYAGRRTALVGHNGSGKSTLIKLMMRLYDPTEGVILLNGVDIRRFNLQDYRRLIGTTFQDFELFSMSVLENVILEKLETKEQREAAVAALHKSGALEQMEKLDKGVDTILTREFDDEGVVLSGGQAQKVAVARCFAKDAPIVLLDEPSSALDPVAEYRMYETIMELCGGRSEKLAVIISHRLSSAAMADTVCLLQGGHLVEQGTHLELMERGGIYADMFRKQAESYMQDAAWS
ncbi:MAG: ABC transporter ATP-binding protein, partial [Lachnospiraceae bacterium]|nr:ABC transporter ATP-binding protein [Lachnospiraceae bacterium]